MEAERSTLVMFVLEFTAPEMQRNAGNVIVLIGFIGHDVIYEGILW